MCLCYKSDICNICKNVIGFLPPTKVGIKTLKILAREQGCCSINGSSKIVFRRDYLKQFMKIQNFS